MCVYICIYIHIYIHIYTHINICTYIYINIYICKCLYKHTHKYIYICIYMVWFYTKETHCKSKNSRVLIAKHFGADLFYLSVLVYFFDSDVETWRSDFWYPPQTHNPEHNSCCVYAAYLNVCMETYHIFMCMYIVFLCVYIHICIHACTFWYGVATLSRLLQIVGLFCRI